MKRRLGVIAGFLLSGVICLGGLVTLGYGGYLASISTSDGNTPFDVPGYVLVMVGLVVMVGGGGLAVLVQETFETEEYDPMDDAMHLINVVYGLLALAAVGFVVRVAVNLL